MRCLFLWKCFKEMLTPSVWWRLWSACRCFVCTYVVLFCLLLFQLYSDGAEPLLILSGPPAELTASDQLSCVARVFPLVFLETTQQPWQVTLAYTKKRFKLAAGACFMGFLSPYEWTVFLKCSSSSCYSMWESCLSDGYKTLFVAELCCHRLFSSLYVCCCLSTFTECNYKATFYTKDKQFLIVFLILFSVCEYVCRCPPF